MTAGQVRTGLRSFRQTRPFWGGLLLLLAGADIIYFAGYPLRFAVSNGWNASAGYILGGGLILFALVSWASPLYAPMLGLLGVLVALAAFISTNLGGLLIGTALGIVGGSMVWAWGEKGPKAAPDEDGSPV
ncbi:DUF6114 domain-containing protein [Luteipulveratus mongoliensis]|uniref:Membrane protein n=1 Tax=Luteipulveratus mongoliensis TaxID=571913 RepID=A0A0K1JDX5_9MICO|nr:DUF6114 domain-containing protein [Luteipulveratus mongoliensis]AKU14911.1 membrane protein [Luteipulveratus mongoliensis]